MEQNNFDIGQAVVQNRWCVAEAFKDHLDSKDQARILRVSKQFHDVFKPLLQSREEQEKRKFIGVMVGQRDLYKKEINRLSSLVKEGSVISRVASCGGVTVCVGIVLGFLAFATGVMVLPNVYMWGTNAGRIPLTPTAKIILLKTCASIAVTSVISLAVAALGSVLMWPKKIASNRQKQPEEKLEKINRHIKGVSYQEAEFFYAIRNAWNDILAQDDLLPKN